MQSPSNTSNTAADGSQIVNLCGASYRVFHLPAFAKQQEISIDKIPYSIKILLENLLRHQHKETVTQEDIHCVAHYANGLYKETEIAFYPARVLMPDSSGLPLLVDLASMRDRVASLGKDPELINPQIPVELVVDHAITTNHAGSNDARAQNMLLEYRRNQERFGFLKWAEGAFKNFRIIPPGHGILHQINVEYLATVVREDASIDGPALLYPDSLVGMDSHTPMVNGLAVIGWGVGGIEAGSAMLGEPISMLVPQVIGCRLTGRVKAGVTSTDIVLTVTQKLRSADVLGKFVEFCGSGLDHLSLADRATIANMAPEYGATIGFFGIDQETIDYLRNTGRASHDVNKVEAYAKLQGLWRGPTEPDYETVVHIDLSSIVPSMAGPRRPEDRVDLPLVAENFRRHFDISYKNTSGCAAIEDGDVVLAAITSCTNTSNPHVMIAAGLLARNAVRRGLKSKPWVKTSLAPGSRRVSEYLHAAGLDQDLDQLGFQTVGYGCMTCMGGSGDLQSEVAASLAKNPSQAVAAVLSGNRNFEGRIHHQIQANYLASPPLVVAYAIAGTILLNMDTDPLGMDEQGTAVYLADIWPSDEEIETALRAVVVPSLFQKGYATVFQGDAMWNALRGPGNGTFAWDAQSTYIRCAPYSDRMGIESRPAPIVGARILAMLSDNVTTDHISPVGAVFSDGPVGVYLKGKGIKEADFNLLISRRANPDVVARTAFSNPRLRNELVPNVEGGYTRMQPNGEILNIFDASMHYAKDKVPLVVIGGKNYGAGSSRDTAAKGTFLIGVRAILAESYERIHRSNLVGMGILPLQFSAGVTRKTLQLTGQERISLQGLGGPLEPRMLLTCLFEREDNTRFEVAVTLRVDTPREMRWIDAGGILPFVGNALMAKQSPKL